jgi:hypothetical protein
MRRCLPSLSRSFATTCVADASNTASFGLNAAADDLQHVTTLQGTKAYGVTVAPMRALARES